MIRVTPAPEPPDFDAKVRQPGLLAIAEMTGQMPTHPRKSGKAFEPRTRKEVQSDGTSISVRIDRPEDLPSSEFKPYWTEAINDLMRAYDEVCAYSCFRIHPVQNTIDRLGLNDFRSYREEDAVSYWEEQVSFARLVKESPFVALELHRQGRLLAGDA